MRIFDAVDLSRWFLGRIWPDTPEPWRTLCSALYAELREIAAPGEFWRIVFERGGDA